MCRRPPSSTRPDPSFPSTTLFRSPCPVKLHTRAVPAGTVYRERPASSFDRIPLLPCPGLARWRAFPLPETPETSMTSADTTPEPGPKFTDLGLPDSLLQALAAVGYESPSPIQAATIPPLLAGRDVLGQAQTGTGKTAAFALPILARVDPQPGKPQALVLAPTRELAIQVAEAFQKYAVQMPGFSVLPIYGGQGYGPQLHALRRGVHVVVGTPGRVIDHLTRGSLDLSELRCLVLDEADEMLRMGFIDDVETVLKKTPETRQVALFSATMPAQIKRIAQTYLKDPVEIAIRSEEHTSELQSLMRNSYAVFCLKKKKIRTT